MTFEDSAMGHYMEGTMALSAEFFRLQNNERAIAMKKARALEGYWPRNAPLGYKHIKVETGKVLIKKEPEATRIKQGLE